MTANRAKEKFLGEILTARDSLQGHFVNLGMHSLGTHRVFEHTLGFVSIGFGLFDHLAAGQNIALDGVGVGCHFTLNVSGIRLVAAAGESKDEMLNQYQDINLHEISVLEDTFNHQETRIAINRGGQSVNFLLPESLSEIAIPLKSRNQVIGILSIHQNDLDSFTQDNIIQFQIIFNQPARN